MVGWLRTKPAEGEILQHHLSGSHDAALVALSVAIAVAASYTALDLAGRVGAASGWARRVWLGTAAVAMGGGIWAMHFVAMLAFSLPVPMAFDAGLTLLSLVVPVTVTGIGFAVTARSANPARIGLAGLLMGLGIAAMHYTGMAAMRMPVGVSYDRTLVAVSVLIAVGASIAALQLSALRTSGLSRALAAGAMGLAISGMHYTAMWAAAFSNPAAPAEGTHGHAGVDQTVLALGVASVTFLILFLSLLAAVVDRRFAHLAEREAAALRASEARFRALYRRTPLPLHSLGPDGTMVEVSDAWLALLGYRREEVVGRPLADFLAAGCAGRHAREHWPTFSAGQDLHEVECQVLAKDGRVLDVLLSASPDRDLRGHLLGWLGGLADITARRRAEEALRQAQKLEAVGQLTGGVAHDFNNLLTVVLGALSGLERHVGGDERARAMLEAARGAVRRGARLSGSLLAFARRQALRPEPVDAAALIQEFTTLIRRAIGETITLELGFEPCLPLCQTDAAQLQTAVLNLVVNARDAMPEGGTLTIRAARAELTPDDLAGNDEAAPGSFVAISVRDTGHGMAPEVLARAFEPFFTTKEVGRGTGLGLAQVYGFVRQLGGHVGVSTRPGEGTTVTLYLPVSHERSTRSLDIGNDPPATVVTVSSSTVLVVEDEAAVREIAAEMLREAGWRVISAADGREALSVLQTGEPVDVLFSDVVMPGLNGFELARAARGMRPGLPVLLTSGYAGAAHGHEEPEFAVLQKPYERHELLRNLGALVPPPLPSRDRKEVG